MYSVYVELPSIITIPNGIISAIIAFSTSLSELFIAVTVYPSMSPTLTSDLLADFVIVNCPDSGLIGITKHVLSNTHGSLGFVGSVGCTGSVPSDVTTFIKYFPNALNSVDDFGNVTVYVTVAVDPFDILSTVYTPVDTFVIVPEFIVGSETTTPAGIVVNKLSLNVTLTASFVVDEFVNTT